MNRDDNQFINVTESQGASTRIGRGTSINADRDVHTLIAPGAEPVEVKSPWTFSGRGEAGTLAPLLGNLKREAAWRNW